VEIQGDEAVAERAGSLAIEAFVHVTPEMVAVPGESPTERFWTLDVIFLTPKGVSVTGKRTVQVSLIPRTTIPRQ
jgi:hypothetical protein